MCAPAHSVSVSFWDCPSYKTLSFSSPNATFQVQMTLKEVIIISGICFPMSHKRVTTLETSP